jgi:hypothetical protein
LDKTLVFSMISLFFWNWLLSVSIVVEQVIIRARIRRI